MTKEPSVLKKGKKFHREVQDNWKATAEGEICPEHSVTKLSGRRGRVDILVDPFESNVVIVEIKASDWDRMMDSNVRRNVRRQTKQVWSYIDSQTKIGKEVYPGIIFPERPKTPKRLKLIESLFNKEGITVVWQDESIQDLKKRTGVI